MSDDLASRFPQLRPIQSAPSLSNFLGTGCMVYGRRDPDAETGTYVKTHWSTILFVPVFALGAYRVADAPQGWFFHGRVPLSLGAKAWNTFLVCLLLGLFGLFWWNVRTNSEAALARKKVDEADRLVEAGDLEQAASLYREVGRGNTGVADEAAEKFRDLLGERLDRAPLRTVNAVVRLAISWVGWPDIQVVGYERGLKLVEQKGKDDPRAAVALLDSLCLAATDRPAFGRRCQTLLESWGAARSDDLELLIALGRACELQGDADTCEKLFAPHAARLGTSEGARLFGQALFLKGELDRAYEPLSAYCAAHLEAAWKVLQAASRGNHDPGLDWQIEWAQRVLVATLDLARVHKYRSQTLPDAAARRAELAKAEKALLAVGSLPGMDTDLHLAQVYVWMGKQDQAEQIFNAHLAAAERAPGALLYVAKAQREVGNIAEARKLIEEAIARAPEEKVKRSLAPYRAMVSVDLEDKITWLERGALDDPEVKALLSRARAEQAEQKGDDEAAARHLRDVVALYDQLKGQVHAEGVNNVGLAYLALYRVTGDRKALARSTELLHKALALQPRNAMIVENVLEAEGREIVRDLATGALDVDALRLLGSPEDLGYLYKDRKGRDGLFRWARKHPKTGNARGLADRLLLLAPRHPASYLHLFALLKLTGDWEAFRQLEASARKADLDLSDLIGQRLDFYAGKKDAQLQKELAGQVRHWEKPYAQLAGGSRGPTFALVADLLSRLLIDSAEVGTTVDADRVVRLAEEAHAAAPSRATQNALISALLFRAHRQLIEQEPAYNQLATRVRRALNADYLLAVVLSREGKLRQAALANKDVRRAGELVRERETEFPDEISPSACVILRALYPEETAARTEALARSEVGKWSRAISLRLSPASASAALECYWALSLAGKEEQGQAILKRCAAQGVPLPFDVR
jgi:hypothetical protein